MLSRAARCHPERPHCHPERPHCHPEPAEGSHGKPFRGREKVSNQLDCPAIFREAKDKKFFINHRAWQNHTLAAPPEAGFSRPPVRAAAHFRLGSAAYVHKNLGLRPAIFREAKDKKVL